MLLNVERVKIPLLYAVLVVRADVYVLHCHYLEGTNVGVTARLKILGSKVSASKKAAEKTHKELNSAVRLSVSSFFLPFLVVRYLMDTASLLACLS